MYLMHAKAKASFFARRNTVYDQDHVLMYLGVQAKKGQWDVHSQGFSAGSELEGHEHGKDRQALQANTERESCTG
jgi:hypothetical protein